MNNNNDNDIKNFSKNNSNKKNDKNDNNNNYGNDGDDITGDDDTISLQDKTAMKALKILTTSMMAAG